MEKAQLIEIWRTFTEKNDFMLNPDKARVEMLADGVLKNEKKHGFKYCPCRLSVGDFKKDISLICPCNFKAQDTWKNKGECWCSLFVRRK
ncbi:MAG: ferredoxin-thioredoxin reductase catalytic domain-containing protein [Candidatus Woesearchaeota archaeon]